MRKKTREEWSEEALEYLYEASEMLETARDLVIKTVNIYGGELNDMPKMSTFQEFASAIKVILASLDHEAASVKNFG